MQVTQLSLRKDLVLVEEYDTPTILLTPDEFSFGSRRATVIKAGREADMAVGDKILFNESIGEPIKLDGKPYLLIKNDDVLAIL